MRPRTVGSISRAGPAASISYRRKQSQYTRDSKPDSLLCIRTQAMSSRYFTLEYQRKAEKVWEKMLDLVRRVEGNPTYPDDFSHILAPVEDASVGGHAAGEALKAGERADRSELGYTFSCRNRADVLNIVSPSCQTRSQTRPRLSSDKRESRPSVHCTIVATQRTPPSPGYLVKSSKR